jgi:hypothetical protein
LFVNISVVKFREIKAKLILQGAKSPVLALGGEISGGEISFGGEISGGEVSGGEISGGEIS